MRPLKNFRWLALATFTSTAGILSTAISGKLADIYGSFGITFVCFGLVALVGAGLACFIRVKAPAKVPIGRELKPQE